MSTLYQLGFLRRPWDVSVFRGLAAGGGGEQGAGAGSSGGGVGSVQEALAGLLPAAGRAPLVPVLDAIHFAALLSLPTGFPGQKELEGCRHAVVATDLDSGQAQG